MKNDMREITMRGILQFCLTKPHDEKVNVYSSHDCPLCQMVRMIEARSGNEISVASTFSVVVNDQQGLMIHVDEHYGNAICESSLMNNDISPATFGEVVKVLRAYIRARGL